MSITVRPASRFTSVDFPVPDEPRRTNDFAGRSSARTLLDPLARDVAHRVDGHADGDVLRLGDLPGVVAHVELREHDHRIGAAVPRRREVALEATRVEVLVEPGDENARCRRWRRGCAPRPSATASCARPSSAGGAAPRSRSGRRVRRRRRPSRRPRASRPRSRRRACGRARARAGRRAPSARSSRRGAPRRRERA